MHFNCRHFVFLAGFALAATASADLSVQTLLTFASTATVSSPSAPLMVGSDGYYYGTIGAAIFRIKPDGTGYLSFAIPYKTSVALTQGSDGALYGVSTGDVIFRVNTDGTGLTTLHTLNSAIGEGMGSYALFQGPDGLFYSTTQAGGANGVGTVYRIDKTGGSFSVLYSFSKTNNDAQSPHASVFVASDGTLYGTTYAGGTTGSGTVYTLHSDGSHYAILHSVGTSSDNGVYPSTRVILASNGKLYGTLYQGAGGGAVFQMNVDGSGYQIVLGFGADGQYSVSDLIEGADGFLYGRTAYAGLNQSGNLFKVAKDGTGYQSLYSFQKVTNTGFPSDSCGLVQIRNGAVYVIEPYGGMAGLGTLITVGTTTGAVATIYDFGATIPMPQPNSFCAGPSGVYFGTTASETLFRVNTDGTGYRNVHFFRKDGVDGQTPGSLIYASDGNLYGITQGGGANNDGVIFRSSSDGSSYSVVYTFPGATTAITPVGLIQGSDGALYVTTSNGGTAGLGAVVKVSRDGSTATVIHNFVISATDGRSPAVGVIQGGDGMLYGGTRAGGASDGGVVFKMKTDGTGFTILHNFDPDSGSGYGTGPTAKLTLGTDGELYGVANFGQVFRLSTDGTQIAYFNAASSLNGPITNVVPSSDGGIYGTATGPFFRSEPRPGVAFRLATDGSGAMQSTPLASPAMDGCMLLLQDGSFIGVTNGYSGLGNAYPGVLFTMVATSPPPLGPVITAPPSSATVNCGSGATLRVTATGTGLTYQWEFNGTAIQGATAATYTLNNTNTFAAGAYSVVVTDSKGTSVTSPQATVGVRVDAAPVNISTRSTVGAGGNVLIAGFVINGTTSATILVRGIGPTLATFGVPNALPSTQLTLYDGSGNPLTTNTGWNGDATLSAAFTRTGAFALPANSADSAILATVPPGAYTAQVSGVNGATGAAMIEVYTVP